jgi:hypothetical protein
MVSVVGMYGFWRFGAFWRVFEGVARFMVLAKILSFDGFFSDILHYRLI